MGSALVFLVENNGLEREIAARVNNESETTGSRFSDRTRPGTTRQDAEECRASPLSPIKRSHSPKGPNHWEWSRLTSSEID